MRPGENAEASAAPPGEKTVLGGRSDPSISEAIDPTEEEFRSRWASLLASLGIGSGNSVECLGRTGAASAPASPLSGKARTAVPDCQEQQTSQTADGQQFMSGTLFTTGVSAVTNKGRAHIAQFDRDAIQQGKEEDSGKASAKNGRPGETRDAANSATVGAIGIPSPVFVGLPPPSVAEHSATARGSVAKPESACADSAGPTFSPTKEGSGPFKRIHVPGGDAQSRLAEHGTAPDRATASGVPNQNSVEQGELRNDAQFIRPSEASSADEIQSAVPVPVPASSAAVSEGTPELTSVSRSVMSGLGQVSQAGEGSSQILSSANSNEPSPPRSAAGAPERSPRIPPPVTAQKNTRSLNADPAKIGASSASTTGLIYQAVHPGNVAENQAGSAAWPVSETAGRTQPYSTFSPRASLDQSEAFSAVDAGRGAPPATWIHAGTRHAEAGYLDPALGWIGVRADAIPNGVHAVLIPGSTEAAQALEHHVAGLSAYISEHHGPAATVTMGSFESGNGGQPGHGGASTQDGGIDPGSRSHSGEDRGAPFGDSTEDLPATSPRSAATVNPGSASARNASADVGRHISVVA